MGTQRLMDIISGGADALRGQWENTQAAQDYEPLPRGSYVARIVSGELVQSKNGTPGYKLSYKVLEGEHAGRQFWQDIWLTPAALPMAKRDLGKLGITSVEQLEQPLPQGIRCKVKLALCSDDDGTTYNRVRSFEVVGTDPDPLVDKDFGPGKREGDKNDQ